MRSKADETFAIVKNNLPLCSKTLSFFGNKCHSKSKINDLALYSLNSLPLNGAKFNE